MDPNDIENQIDDLKMEHSKIELDSVDCDNNVQSMETHMHSDLDSLNHTNSSGYDTSLMMGHHNTLTSEDITAHLASSGMAGVAAAAAIATSQRKSMLYNFETVPAVRKRHSTRLLRKIQQLVDEFSVRVGQQACLLVCSPKSAYKSPVDSLSNNIVFKVFGASPLDNVLRNLRDVITQELENSLQNYQIMNSSMNYYQPTEILPPLMVDGIPTPLDKMTQAQLRAFIPVMLKYSTGRTKPAWGRPISRPPWWPDDVPWANVRSDVRTDEEKQRQSWTNALKKVVRCCYEYHGKSHYLHDYHSAAGMNPNEIMVDHHGHQMMDHGQMMDMEGHHHNGTGGVVVDYGNHHDQHHHMQNQVSGRHMLLNEQDAVEAQLRAIQSTYSIPGSHEGGMMMSLDSDERENQQGGDSIQQQINGGGGANNMNEYATMSGDPNMRSDSGQHIKVEDLVNFPPGTVVQLDSNSTAELFNLLASSNPGGAPGAGNHHGNEMDRNLTHEESQRMQQQQQQNMESHSSGSRSSHRHGAAESDMHASTRDD